MDKLTITNKVNTLAGTQGVVDNVTSTVGYQTVLIAMVDMGYLSVQTHREDWKFLKDERTVAIGSGDTPSYQSDEIAKYHRIIYDKVVLEEIAYDDWLLRDTSVASAPTEYTVREDGTVFFNAFTENYSVTIQSYLVPDEIVANSDTPVIPTQYHMIIVYKALIHLGEYLFNQSLINAFTMLYSIELGRLMRSQVPNRGSVNTGAFA